MKRSAMKWASSVVRGNRSGLRCALLAAVLPLVFLSRSYAADYTWNADGGAAYAGVWTDTSADGWNGGVPGPSDSALIDNGTVTANGVNQQVQCALTIGSGGVLDSGSFYLYFNNGSLTLNSGTINITGPDDATYGSSGLGSLVTAASGNSFINDVSSPRGLTLEGYGTTFAGEGNLAIGIGLRDSWYGPCGITKSGGGMLTLSGQSTFTGVTTHNGGSLKLASVSGPALQGNVATSWGVWLLLTEPNQFGPNSVVVLNGGEVVMQGTDQTVAGLSGPGIVENDHNWSPLGPIAGGTATLTVSNSTFYNFLGTIRDTAAGNGKMAIIKNGMGTLRFENYGYDGNTYSGTTTVNQGVLELRSASGWAQNGSRAGNQIIINSGATLSTLYNHEFGFTGTLADITVNDGGTYDGNGCEHFIGNLFLNGNAIVTNNNYFGLTGGSLTYTGTGSQSATVATTFYFQTVTPTKVDATITVNGSNPAGDLTINGALADSNTGASMTKAGLGKLVLGGTCSYRGATTVNGGTLSVTGSGQLYASFGWGNIPITVASNSVLEVDRWGSYGSFGELYYDRGNIVMDGGTIRYTGNTLDVWDSRGLTIGANGATLESQAPAGQSWNINTDPRERCDIASDAAGTLTLGGAGNGLVAKIIPGAGALVKTDAGTWTLSGINTYSGDTVVSNGTLRLTQTQALATTTAVLLDTGAVLNLDFEGIATVRSLKVGDRQMSRNTLHSAANVPGVLTGAGFIRALEGPVFGTVIRIY